MRNRILAGALGAVVLAFALNRLARPRYSLAGKVVVVTGGSRGLGLVMARELARRGAKLVLVARDADELARARDELRRGGAEVVALPCDITDRAAVDAMVTTAIDWFGRVDVLVNNAGIIEVGPQSTMTIEDYEAAMNTHFWGPLYLTFALAPHMRARREGRIVNIASIGGLVSVPHLLPYSASKFALVGLSEGLRAELRKDGIQVVTVCPGLMRTGSTRNALFKGDAPKEQDWFRVSGSLPLLSINAVRAARRIVRACIRGEAHVVLSPQAKIAAAIHGVAPGMTADVLGVVDRLLPRAEGGGGPAKPGRENETRLTESWLTALDRRAALSNNEMGGTRRGRGAPS